MADTQLTLTAEERQLLVELLDWVLKETLVEERRTSTLKYRELVHHREELISGLLRKLGQPAG
jgi:hypothetical protein